MARASVIANKIYTFNKKRSFLIQNLMINSDICTRFLRFKKNIESFFISLLPINKIKIYLCAPI